MDPRGAGYITVVHVTVGGERICLHSQAHRSPRVPEAVAVGVETFNADPAAAWVGLVGDAIAAEMQLIADRRGVLDSDEAHLRDLRQRLLGARA